MLLYFLTQYLRTYLIGGKGKYKKPIQAYFYLNESVIEQEKIGKK